MLLLCHGPDAHKRESEFRLDTEEGAFACIKRVKRGNLLWVAVMWKESMLYHRIISEIPGELMRTHPESKSFASQQLENRFAQQFG